MAQYREAKSQFKVTARALIYAKFSKGPKGDKGSKGNSSILSAVIDILSDDYSGTFTF